MMKKYERRFEEIEEKLKLVEAENHELKKRVNSLE